jgi:hypothetical protein
MKLLQHAPEIATIPAHDAGAGAEAGVAAAAANLERASG